MGWREERTFFIKKQAIYEIKCEEDDSVKRSRSDFEKLWEIIEGNYCYFSQLIPALPSKQGENSATFEGVCCELSLALQVIYEHPILGLDEYFKSFLRDKFEFMDRIQFIKNVKGPLNLKKEYFEKENIVKRLTFSSGRDGMSKDFQYLKVMNRVQSLTGLKDKLKTLVQLYDRLNYEGGEVLKAAQLSDEAIKKLLYLNKSERLHSEDQDRIGEFLKSIKIISKENQIVCFLKFSVSYLNVIDKLTGRLDRFRVNLGARRDLVSEVSRKMESIQCVGDHKSKPSFDLIFKTKLRHEKMLTEIAVIEVDYEKYIESIEKELNWISNWIKQNLRPNLTTLYSPFT